MRGSQLPQGVSSEETGDCQVIWPGAVDGGNASSGSTFIGRRGEVVAVNWGLQHFFRVPSPPACPEGWLRTPVRSYDGTGGFQLLRGGYAAHRRSTRFTRAWLTDRNNSGPLHLGKVSSFAESQLVIARSFLLEPEEITQSHPP